MCHTHRRGTPEGMCHMRRRIHVSYEEEDTCVIHTEEGHQRAPSRGNHEEGTMKRDSLPEPEPPKRECTNQEGTMKREAGMREQGRERGTGKRVEGRGKESGTARMTAKRSKPTHMRVRARSTQISICSVAAVLSNAPAPILSPGPPVFVLRMYVR